MIYFRPAKIKSRETMRNIEEAGFVITDNNIFNDNDIIWNWGNPSPIYGGLIFNPPENIKNASNKVIMASIIGDLMPTIYEKYSTDIPVPFVVKKNHTSKGKFKKKILRHRQKTEQIVSQYDIIQDFVNIIQEYRVVVAWNGSRYIIARIYTKTRPPDASRIFKVNWIYSKVKVNNANPEIKSACIEAVRRLKLHVAGVDIAETDKGVKIFEVNSAPGMGANSAKKLYKVIEGSNGNIKRWE